MFVKQPLEDVYNSSSRAQFSTHSSKPDSDPLLFELVAWVNDEAPRMGVGGP